MTLTDPLTRADLHATVDALAIATKKLANVQEEVDKLPKMQAEVDRLKGKLLTMLDKAGFTEEAVELLLAAR